MNINNLAMFNYYSIMRNNGINSSQNNFQFVGTARSTAMDSSRADELFNKYSSDQTNFDNIGKLSTAATIKSDAEKLLSSAKSITEIGNKGVFSEKTAISEDETKITATAENGAYNTTYSLNVNQIAKAQVNTSNTVDKLQISSVNNGTNTITIKIGDKEKDINFNTTAGDTNEIVLNKMAKAINKENVGVTSLVTKNNTGGISLQLSAEKTGENNKFTITDKVGNAAATTGITNVSTIATNAKYTLNNLSYTSSSNDVTVDKGKVTLNLKNVTNNAVKVTIKQDSNKIAQDIETFTNDYNNIVKDASNNGISTSSIKGMITAVKNNNSNLENMGISINADNTLSIDKKKLVGSIDSNFNMVKDTLTGYKGIAEKIENFSKSITQNPFTATGITALDVYSNSMIMAYPYGNQGSILNLYR